ncbi:hypothetical protein KW784_01850 [Candidatus Parcubacteria bacterium]|nr:hypothetical protein [Candidatus Parcubacteria bacterium]
MVHAILGRRALYIGVWLALVAILWLAWLAGWWSLAIIGGAIGLHLSGWKTALKVASGIAILLRVIFYGSYAYRTATNGSYSAATSTRSSVSAPADNSRSSITVTHDWSVPIEVPYNTSVTWEHRDNVAYEIQLWRGNALITVKSFPKNPEPDTRDACERFVWIKEGFNRFQIRLVDKEIKETIFDLSVRPYQRGGPCAGYQKATPEVQPERVITITREWSELVEIPVGYRLHFDTLTPVAFAAIDQTGEIRSYPRDYKTGDYPPRDHRVTNFRFMVTDPDMERMQIKVWFTKLP